MQHPEELGGNVWLFPGDCMKAMRKIKKNRIDACVTDPPYHLVSIVKRFGKKNSAPAQHGRDGAFARTSKGFMGQTWDGGDIAFRKETWLEVYRVLKPGAHLVAFCGDKNYHRLACAIEDAGFEVRGMFLWLHGQGFPKNKHSIKPAVEPICFARKPLTEKSIEANIKKWGTGGLNVNDCRIGEFVNTTPSGVDRRNATLAEAGYRPGEYQMGETTPNGSPGRWPANVIHDGSIEVLTAFPDAPGQLHSVGPEHGTKKAVNVYSDFGPRTKAEPRDRRKRKPDGVTNFAMTSGFPHDDSGSAARFFYQANQDHRCLLCSAHVEDAEKDLKQCPQPSGGSAQTSVQGGRLSKIARNVKSAGDLCDSCAIAIAQKLVAMRQDQDPASLPFPDFISEPVAQILNQSLALYVAGRENTDTILTIPNLRELFGSVFHAIDNSMEASGLAQEIALAKSVSRFRYDSKADKDDRMGLTHPTVKPVDLMRWLVRLITPKGGWVLDPFAGTGSTAEAAWREKCKTVLIEKDPAYQAMVRKRTKVMLDGRYAREVAKQARKKPLPGDLFK